MRSRTPKQDTQGLGHAVREARAGRATEVGAGLVRGGRASRSGLGNSTIVEGRGRSRWGRAAAGVGACTEQALSTQDQVFQFRASYLQLLLFCLFLHFVKNLERSGIRSETSRAPAGMRAVSIPGRKHHQFKTIYRSLDVPSNPPHFGKEKTLFLGTEHPL